MKKGSGTRSGLLWEVERLLNECDTELPQVLLMENVPAILNKKNKPDFDEWCSFLETKGYSNCYQVLNAKDYGIPQNRKRCFMVSILGDYYYEFPKPIPLKLKLKDMLEDNVDEKYYLSNKMIKYISCTGTGDFSNSDCKINLDIARPLTTDNNKRAGTTNYLSNNLPDNYDLANIKEELNLYDLGIRRLTPKECWRLMGFSDEDFNKASKVNSNAQLYKQAGNSIVVNVLMAIFKEMM